MSKLILNAIPGLRRLDDEVTAVEVPEDGASVLLALLTTSPALGEGTRLDLRARLESSGGQRRVILSQASAMAQLHQGQLELRGFEIQLTFQGSGGDLSSLAADGVAASGNLRWSGGAQIGLTDPVELELAFREGAFRLQAKHTLQWPVGAWQGLEPTVQLDGGASLAVRPLPLEAAVVVTLKGNASWVSGGPVSTAVETVRGLVERLGVGDETLLGVIDSLGLGDGPVHFSVRLQAAEQGGWTLDGWNMGFQPVQEDAAWPDLDALIARIVQRIANAGQEYLEAPLALSLGRPTFSMGQAAAGEAGWSPQSWELWFRQCELGLPSFAGLAGAGLRGELRLRRSGGQDLIEFLPGELQAVDLPEVLRFLLAELRFAAQWIATAELWDLDEIYSAGGEWLGFFRGILSDSPEQEVLDNALTAASAALGGPERAFSLLFEAIASFDSPAAQSWARLAWQSWDKLLPALSSPQGLAGALDLLTGLGDLGRSVVRCVAEALAAVLSQSAGWRQHLTDLMGLLGDRLEAGGERRPLLLLAIDILAGAVRATAGSGPLDGLPDALRGLAKGLLSFLAADNDPAWQLDAAREPNAGNGPRMPLPHWLLGQALSALAWRVPGLEPLPAWARVPDPGPAFQAWLDEIGASLDIPREQLLRFCAAFLEAADADLSDLSSDEKRDQARAAVRRERQLLRLVRRFPPLVLPMLAAEVVRAVPRRPPVLGFIGRDIGNDPRLRTLRLPPPGTKDARGKPRRYLVVSDLHRDCRADDEGAVEFGSIDHFRDNRRLYAALLTRARDEGWTLIENGDCEELWFIQDPWEDVEREDYAKLARIIDDNREIYGLLWELAREGRYFRVFGNHDSYLRLWWYPSTAHNPGAEDWPGFRSAWRNAAAAAGVDDAELSDLQELRLTDHPQAPTRDWEPYDFLIVDGVKTMTEHNALALLTQAGEPAEMLRGRLGMDASEYTETKPLIVCHGHQFDFWNCDANAMLGKLISNSLAVPADGLMDPLLDLRGIALAGRALVDFRDALARSPVVSNWLDRHPALRMAHAIQHQDDRSRLPIDDYEFSETDAILVANFLMPLSAPRLDDNNRILRDAATGEVALDEVPDGAAWVDGWSVDEVADALAAGEPGTAWDKAGEPLAKYRRFYGSQLCIGHTHTPQSQPYLKLPGLVSPLFGGIVALLRGGLDGLMPGLGSAASGALGHGESLPVRAGYFNTGTGSWLRGIVWGLEIDPAGTPRLTYFTASSRAAEDPGGSPYAGRELEAELNTLPIDARERLAALLQRLKPADLDGPFYMDWELEVLPEDVRRRLDELAQTDHFMHEIQGVWEGVQTWWGKGFQAFKEALGEGGQLSLPPYTALLTRPLAGAAAPTHLEGLAEALSASDSLTLDGLQGGLAGLQGTVMQALVALAQRAAGMARGDDEVVYSVRVPLAGGALSWIDDFSGLLDGLLPAGQSTVGAAGVLLSALQNLPFLGRAARRADGTPIGFLGPAPLVGGACTVFALLGGGAEIGDQRLSVELRREAQDLLLTLRVGPKEG